MQPEIPSYYFNIFIAFSNIMGIPILSYVDNWSDYCLVLVAIVCSTLMHLSERKHQLPGIFPFNEYSTLFLNLDRCFAIFVGGYLIYTRTIRWYSLVAFLLGLMCMLKSERFSPRQIEFGIYHITWHFFAYVTILLMLYRGD